MEEHSYGEIAELERDNWWYVARRELVESVLSRLGRRFSLALDLGCGTGANYAAIAAHAEAVDGLDLSQEALDHCKTLGYRTLQLASAERTGLPSGAYDFILCADLLEHGDDVSMVREIARLLKPEGVALITVPAHPVLWNWNDLYGHHKRRYTKCRLAQLLADQPFAVRWMRHWNASSFFPLLVVSGMQRMLRPPKRLSNNLDAVPQFLNKAALRMLRFENAFIQRRSLPFGVSYVSVLQRYAPAP